MSALKRKDFLPLSQRPFDRMLVGWYSFSLFFALMMDCLNFLAPVGKIAGPALDNLVWPPSFMRAIFTWWCEMADPVLWYNPLWYKIICGYSPLFHAPFYVAAIYCLVTGNTRALGFRIRDWALFWAGWMMSGVIPVFAESLGVEGALYPSPRKWLFLAGYGSFLVFPVLTVVRFGRDTQVFADEALAAKAATAAGADAVVAGSPSSGKSKKRN